MNSERIDRYWSDFFGVEKDDIRSTGIMVVPHNYLAGYQGAWIFKHNERILISVPPQMEKEISNRIVALEPDLDNMFSQEFINHLFGNTIQKVIGPTYQGFFDQLEFMFPISNKVVKLSYAEHYELIHSLSRSGDVEGWSYSGVNKINDGIFGSFVDDSIVSIGCYKMIKGEVGFVGVYTHPGYRGKGFSQNILKKMVLELSERGKLIRYQTLMSNKPSIRIATKIGFRAYASHIAIRLGS